MELHNERLFDVKERAYRKWLLPILIVVVAVGLPAVWFGPGAFSYLQQERLFRKATRSLEGGDVPGGAIFLRRVLVLNPDHVNATRAMAGVAESYLPFEAARLRERVCQLVPASLPDATAWAQAALRTGQMAQAEEAFERMKQLGPPDAIFHTIGGRVALGLGQVEEARAHFLRALEIEPANEGTQSELAAIEIRLADTAVRDRAREKLAGLQANPKLRHAARRALLGDRVERGLISEALVFAQDFIADPEATFADRLQYLAILRTKEDPSFAFITSFNEPSRIPFGFAAAAREPSFAAYLNDLQAEAAADATKVSLLLGFLNSRRLSLLASEWAGKMAREIVSGPPVAPPLAEAYLLTLDWRRLEELVSAGDWGVYEFLRFAYRSRAALENGDRPGSTAHWTTAVKLTEYRHERLVTLARSASAWGWSSECEEILWISAKNSQRPREALEELAQIHRSKGETQKLFTVWSSLLALDPASVTARKNWARLSFILKGDPYRTGAMAEELYRQHPEDPDIAVTYALVQRQRELHPDALAIMNRLPPDVLRSPLVAGFYGVILAANRRNAEAAEFLALGKGAPLLREEEAIVESARRLLH